VWPFSGPVQTHSSQCSHHHSGHPHPGSSPPVVKARLHQCLQPREGGVYISVTLYSRVGKGIEAYVVLYVMYRVVKAFHLICVFALSISMIPFPDQVGVAWSINGGVGLKV